MAQFGKPSDSVGDAPTTTDAEANANKTTSPVEGGDDKVSAEVSDAEAKALDGAAGPNRTPAFSKRDFADENVQLTDTNDLASAKAGAAAHTKSTVDLAGLEAAAAAGSVREGAEDEVQFTSTPISALRIGPYQFENGVLRLKGDDVDKFEKLLDTASIRTKQVIRRIDRNGGEAVARRFLESTKGTRTSGVDTSDRGVQAPRPAGEK